MRLNLLRLTILISCFICFTGRLEAQSFSFNCSRDTLVPGCPANLCITLKGVIPDIRRQTTSYTLNPSSHYQNGCLPVYLAPNDPGGTSANLTIDDRYTGIINPGFPFPFYGTVYNNVVASTNGYISFDATVANTGSHWTIGANLPSTTYDRALIMGPYHDLNPAVTTSPTRRIQYQVWGAAPHRRWILSFYRVPLFGGACGGLFENTHQIVLYESTGIIEVTILSKQTCASWNNGRAMVGIQDFARSLGMMAPGRAGLGPSWNVANGSGESWRFVPAGGTPLIKRAELLTLGGAVIATDPAPASIGNGKLEASFNNICPPAGATTSYIIRSVYESIDNPAVEIFGTDTVRVNRSQGLAGNATFSAGSCAANNGTVTVSNVTGGNGIYQYSIDGGPFQGSNVFTGLAAGTHTVTITDGSTPACTMTLSVVVLQTGFLTANVTANATTCSGLNNGEIIVTTPGGGGAGPYNVTFNGGSPQSVPALPHTFTGLAPGTYNVTVTHVPTNCTTQSATQVTITVGPGVTGDVTTTPASCFFATNGTATITPTAGTGPFSFQMYSPSSGPFTANGPYTFSNLPGGSGSYVIITDATGCPSGNIPITINAPNNTSSAVATPSCGPSGGTITVTPVGGTIYTYSISLDGGTTYQPGQSSNVFSGLPPGTYPIRVNHGDPVCNSITSATVTSAPPLTATLSQTDVAPCNGGTNGSITVTPTSGTTPYIFSIDGGAGISSGGPYTFMNVTGGAHTVSFQDANGCVFTQSVTINEPAAITGSTTVTGTTCNGASNGSVEVTVTGGGSFAFSIDGAPPFIRISPATFTNLTSGGHTVVITNTTTNCSSAPIPFTIPAGPALTATTSVTATSCPGVNDGTIQITPNGGGAPFLYTLDGTNSVTTGGTSYTYTGVAAGPHTIVVTNSFGCVTGVINVTVLAGPPLTANAIPSSTSCNGGNDGSILVNTSAGPGTYSISLNGALPVSSTLPYTFTSVAAGNHTVVVTNAAGCNSGPINVTVAAGPAFTATASSSATSCSGATDGTITVLLPAGGSGNYSITLDGGAAVSSTLPYTFTGVASGPHTVVVTNSAGCVSPPINVPVGAGPAITATATSNPASCGGSNGSITVNPPSGGTAPYEYTLDGITWQNSNVFNGLAAATYTVRVRDAGAICVITISVTVGQTATVTATATSTIATCGGSNGTITVNPPSGGTAPYQYSLDGITWQNGNTFSGLAAGTYTVSIRDAGATVCTITIPVTVGQTTAITATGVTITMATCGGFNGSITVNAPTGGTAPYQYSLDGITWQSSNVFTGIAAGTYTVRIRDAGAVVCSTTITNVTVSQTSAITAAGATTTIASCGGANGSITVNAPSGGTAPYQYSLDGITWQNSNVFNGIPSGTYTVSIRDAGAVVCSTTITNVTVGQTSGVTAAGTSTTIATCGGANGSITVNAPSGGTAPYQYSLDGITWQNSNVFNGLAAGTYTVSIRDAGTVVCSTTISNVIVGQTSAITAAGTSTTIATCGGANGSITVNAPSGGTAPYQYSLDGITWQNSNVFNGLAAGTYTVSIRDAGTVVCSTTITNVTVGQTSAITAAGTSTTIATCGGANGSITVNAPSGGTAPYQYSLDGITWQNSNVFNGLAAGTYTVNIRDAGGVVCSTTIPNVIVGQTSAITAAGTSTTIATCGGANGSITVNAPSGGTAPYQYSLDGVTWQNSNVFNGLAAGTYTVSIRDAGTVMCSTTITNVTVGQTSAITAAGTSTTIATCGGANGSITVNAPSGGTAPYQYSLDGITWQISNIFNGLASGTYIVSIRDAGTVVCSITITNVTVGQTSAIAAAGTSTTIATCGSSNGGITVNVPSGGTAPYQYSLDGITWQNSNVFTGLAAGTYTVSIRDAGAVVCNTTIANVTVGQTSAVTAAGAITTMATCGGSNGDITVNAPSGGTAPYQYSLDGITWQNGNSFTGLAGGNYSVWIRDASAVCSAIFSVTIGQTTAVTATTSTTIATCGAINGSITVNATAGGTAPYQYSLDGITWQNSNVFNGLAAGTYTVSIRDAGAVVCSTTITNVTVGQTSAITAAGTSTTIATCGGANGSITVNAPSGGTAPYQYSLDGIIWQNSNVFNGLAAGTYTVSIRDAGAVVCSTTITNVTVGQTSAITAAGTSTTIASCGGANGSITVNVPLGGTAPYQYSLDGITWQNSNIFNGLAAGTYTVSIRDAGAVVCGTTITNVTVGQTSAITAAGTSTTIATCGGANGSITVNAPSGGTAPYQYSLDGITWQNSNVFNGLAAGTYTVSIRDAGTVVCSTTITNVTVGQTSAITAAGTSTTIATCGGANGSITVNAPSGGTAPYQYSLDGITWQNSNVFNGLASGTYTVSIRDAGTVVCSTTITNVTVGQTSAVTAGTTTTPATCGNPNGSITVTGASGGTAPYQYSLDGITWQNGTTFTGLAGGNYTVWVRDAAALCSTTIPVTISSTAAVTSTVSATSTTCGTSTGVITAAATTGGTTPYQYSLDGITWQNSNIFPGLPAGNYNVQIIDAGAVCTTTIPVTVNQTGSLAATTTTTTTACTGINNGSVTITTAGGSGPYTFSLDGGAAQPGPLPFTFNNVGAGNHTVLVTDLSSACNSGILNVTVAAGAGVNGTSAGTATTCPTATNGSITITTTAGVAPFTFQLDAGLPQAGISPYTFSNVAAGAHTVIITDNVGCTFTLNQNVAAGPALAATTASTATSCTGINNGTITITPTNGTAPYSFSLDGGATVTGAVPYIFTNIAAGPHTIVMSDAAGCVTNTINVSVTAGATLTATATSTATSCTGVSNGTITVTPTGGAAPYAFSLDGGASVAGAAPYTFTNVAAGAHTIVMTDGAGCATNNINVTVTAGTTLTATATSVSTSCSGATNGTITITPGGGVAPYSFSLDGGVSVVGAAPYTFNNVAAGTHTIVMTDGAGCATNVINVTVTAGATLTATATSVATTCNGATDGTITVTPGGGVAPYSFSLDGGAGVTGAAPYTFNNIAAGAHTVVMTDGAGCVTNIINVTVGQPAPLTASATSVAAICNGQSNGIITVTTNGGNLPYQYSIDAGTTWQNSNVFTVAAGNYTITIRDLNNCTITQTITVTEPGAITASSVNISASCNGGNDGVITVSANGGNGGFQYSLDGIIFQASNIFNVGPGNYNVTVRDNLGCTNSFATTVGLGSNFILVAPPDPTICEGTSVQLNLNSNATQFVWATAPGLSSYTVANPVANPVVTTAYTVTATFGRCSGTATVTVNVNPAPIPNAGPDATICSGQTHQLQGSGGVIYSWSPNTYLNIPSISNPISSATKNITYTLSILSDINGCASLVNDQVDIVVTPPVTVRTFPYDTIGYSGDQFQLLAVASDPGVINYSWSPSTGLSDPTVANPIVTVGATGDVTQYQVTATTLSGCRGVGNVTVRVYKGPDIYVPTGFTPNNDGRNDKFTPIPVGMKSYTYFRVFNRWGQLVFSTTKLHDGWDGKLGGKDQSSGVFIWMIEGVTKDDRVIKKKGTVALIR